MSQRRKSDKKRFRRLSVSDRAIVFYAEDGDSWVHYEPIVHALTNAGRTIVYITSDEEDPAIERESPGLIPIVTDDGMARALMFQTMEAGVVVMTVPGLDTAQLKRSRAKPPFHPHYVYVFHSMVSAHMIYEPEAFDHYDAILCVRPHHREEIRARETAWGLKQKRLIDHGYGRLDQLLVDAPVRLESDRPTVIVAPSWGPDGLIETAGVAAVESLLAADLDVVLRPHPMTRRTNPDSSARLERFCANQPRVRIESGIRSADGLYAADVMVSDWSGVALEYSFALARPVVFVDLPRKINNERYVELGIEPIEVAIREEIGSVVAPSEVSSLGAHVRAVLADSDGVCADIGAVRERSVFNIGRSGEVGAAYIAGLADEYLSAI